MYLDKTQAEVIADTIYDGVRLTTMRVTFPRFILAEFNTHRVFSRNSASSRAIPVKRQIELVRESPFVPQQWPKNQAGMQAKFSIRGDRHKDADTTWKWAIDEAVTCAEGLAEIGVHKQIASRLLEPFMWHTVIVSSTEWENFFAQRDHEDAQPEMQALARAMRKALEESTPRDSAFHVPFRTAGVDERTLITAVARCARVSYGRELEEKTYEEGLALVERLIKGQHWSPFEHVGIVHQNAWSAMKTDEQNYAADDTTIGNFDPPWSQLRHHWREYLPSVLARIEAANHPA